MRNEIVAVLDKAKARAVSVFQMIKFHYIEINKR